MSMRASLTHAEEDYLKAIHQLAAAQGRVGTTELADRLGITPPSVTGMIRKMAAADPPLVEYRKHRGVLLTPEGEAVALEIIRHHRLLELFLFRTLGYSWDEVHDEADRLEHVISEHFEERIARALDHPSRDPHGDPIPTRELRMPPSSDLPLSGLRRGQAAVVKRVDSADLDLLRHLDRIGLTPGTRLQVLEYSPLDGNLHLLVAGRRRPLILGPRVTDRIFVGNAADSHAGP